MKSIVFIIALAILISSNLFGQDNRDSLYTKVGFTIKLKSQVLNDDVKLYIHLPFNYNEDKEFPLVFLLDACTAFKPFAASTELMAYEKSIPSCIVIGFRQYDYVDFKSGDIEAKMGKLYRFIGQEVFPYLQSKYNLTKSIIWGQGGSAGLISTYFMLEYPGLFDGYISDVPNLTLISDKVNSESAFKKCEGEYVSYYLFGSETYNFYNESFINNLQKNAPEGLAGSIAQLMKLIL